MLRTRQMAYPAPTKDLSWPSLDVDLLFAPSSLLWSHPSHKDMPPQKIFSVWDFWEWISATFGS